MEEKELHVSTVRAIRTVLVIAGTATGYLSIFLSSYVLSYSVLIASLCISVYGCYL
jgi:hypothetical protein